MQLQNIKLDRSEAHIIKSTARICNVSADYVRRVIAGSRRSAEVEQVIEYLKTGEVTLHKKVRRKAAKIAEELNRD